MSRIHAFTVDYRERESSNRALFDRGFFVHNLPRLIPACRLFGHKPVVDGVGDPDAPYERRGLVSRWVCCDRCGVRPDPQGQLDPTQHSIGSSYVGPWGCPIPEGNPGRRARMRELKDADTYPPGPWPDRPVGEIGGQLVLGRSFSGFSVAVAVGGGGSEHTLSGHVQISPLGALYLHTERFGAWLQRRINPTSLESKHVELSAHSGRLHWQLWADDNGGSRKGVPRWRNGSIRIDPRDVLLGNRRYTYTDVGEPVTATVRMPHGDDHEVTLQLKQQAHGRDKGWRRLSWIAHWDSAGDGIPTKPGGRGRIRASGVPVSDASAQAGTWPHEAAAAIASRLAGNRTRDSYRPAAAVA